MPAWAARNDARDARAVCSAASTASLNAARVRSVSEYSLSVIATLSPQVRAPHGSLETRYRIATQLVGVSRDTHVKRGYDGGPSYPNRQRVALLGKPCSPQAIALRSRRR